MDQQDQRGKAVSSETKSEPNTFSEAEYSANPGNVVAHAAATGTAIVAASDGRPLVVIRIPTVDLPTLGD